MQTETEEARSMITRDNNPDEYEYLRMEEKREQTPWPERTCEFCGERLATVYGGYRGADSWAGWSCTECAAAARGFEVWDRQD